MNHTNFPTQPHRAPQWTLPQLWQLLERQVKDYHKHYRMGENSSVTQETAQALLSSIQFTAALVPPQETLAATLALGQAALEEKLAQTRRLWQLATAALPKVDDDWLPHTLTGIGRFLDSYDLRFFADRTPQWEYPLLSPPGGGLRGIFYAEAYLRSLFPELQILNTLDCREIPLLLEAVLRDHWSIPMNLCEQALINGLGRVLLELPVPPLSISEAQCRGLSALLGTHAPEDILPPALSALGEELGLAESGALACLEALLPQLLPRLKAALPRGDLSHIFVISHEC